MFEIQPLSCQLFKCFAPIPTSTKWSANLWPFPNSFAGKLSLGFFRWGLRHTLTAAVHALPTWLVTAYEEGAVVDWDACVLRLPPKKPPTKAASRGNWAT